MKAQVFLAVGRYFAGVRRVGLRRVFCLAALWLVACAQLGGQKPPAVAPNGTLSIAGADGAAGPAGPFRVVFSGPEGEVQAGSEISVMFSRPLRALELAGAETVPRIALSPNVSGRWQWIGTSALIFVPESGRLPSATRFTVEVPADLRALDGSTLGKPHRFEFQTARPKLVRSRPYAGEQGRVPATKIELFFNQPVDPKVVQRLGKLRATRAGKASSLAFEAARPDAAAARRIEVRPRNPLPVHSAIAFELEPSFVGQEGPLTADSPIKLEFHTYGPLVVERVTCSTDTPHRRCEPGRPLSIEFSNPVKLREVKRLLSVTPALKLRWESWQNDDDDIAYASVVAPFKAGATYTLRIGGELRDRYGQKLGRPFVQAKEFDDHFPTVEIGVQGDYFEPAASRPIPVASVNVAGYELVTASLNREQVTALYARQADDARFDAIKKLGAAKAERVEPKAPVNQLSERAITPADVLGGAARRGPLAIGIRYTKPEPGPPPRASVQSAVRVVQVTDLAISAKLSRHGSLVWVSRLSNGQPAGNVEVELRLPNAAPRRYTTDAQGMVMIPARDFGPSFVEGSPESQAILFAKSGDDWTFRRVADHLDPWRMPVPVDLSGSLETYGLLFTERGIYRPGDTVHVKGIVRLETPRGNDVPAGRTFDLVLRTPEGEDAGRRSVTTTRFGSFSVDVKVPPGAALGNWALMADMPGDGDVHGSFEVAEYRPAEFKVSVQSSRPSYVRGDKADWTARADYLYGAPMSGAQARYTVTRAPTAFAPPGSEEFVTDASAFFSDFSQQALHSGEIQSAEKKLDGKGELPIGLKLELPGQREPELVSVDTEVSDITRQALAGSTSAIVHPAEFYLGLKLSGDYFVATPGKLSATVVTLSPDGKRLAGKPLLVELVRRRWTLARQDTGAGALHAVSKPVDTVVGSCALTSAGAPLPCSIDVREGGYYVFHATAKDARGNVAHAATSAYAIGEGRAAFGDSDELTVKLVPNKKQYKVGDRAQVLVKSPFPSAEALVTVERAGVYRAERVTLRGSTPTVTVPITEDLRPNAYVGVHLVRPRTGPVPARGRADAAAPTYRVGYAELPIDPEARRLKIDLRPSQRELLPGATLSVDLQVTDRAGKGQPAEVTLYAVDEGVLSLINYQVPDPLAVFTRSRRLQVATLESRSGIAKIQLDEIGALGLEKGEEGGGGGESSARRDFRQSAYYNPSVLADANGRAKVSFKLPDSLTTYRIMAIATTAGDYYGFGQTNVVTSKRLMARPALPRFVRAGDAFEAGVVVSAKGFGPSPVTVRAAGFGLQAQGALARSIQLGRDQSLEVRFPFRAERAGKASFRFEVAGENQRDVVEIERKIDSPAVLEAVALYGETQAAAAEKLGDLSQIRRDVGSLDLSVASTALIGLDAGAAQLIEYPYGCTEQLSSRLMPLLPLKDLARDFRFELPKNTPALIDKTVGDLIARQRGDGGFGMWPDSRESSPWASAYAVWTLDQARRRGGAVSASVITRGRDYLRRYLASAQRDPIGLSTAAFFVDVLAELGAPDAGYMNQLYQARKQLPVFARALLLHALAISKQKGEPVETLVHELENGLRLEANAAYVAENLGDEYAVLMDSTARSGALVLRALMAAQPNHPLGSKLARGLLLQRRGGSWRSTQETAFALLALDGYRRTQERELPDFNARVWMGEAELLSAGMHGRSADARRESIAVAKLPQNSPLLAFEKNGTGTLFYEARLKYAKQTLPGAPLDRGFFVQKTLRRVTPQDLNKALGTLPERSELRFGAGDLVLADLVIMTPSPREYVVIDDPLPAGLEAIDSRLATTAAWLRVPGSDADGACVDCEDGSDDELAHGRAFLSSWYRQETRDDRVLFFVDHMAAGMYRYRYLARATTIGSFVVPPAKAEAMYAPEVFGRTAAAKVDVTGGGS